MIPARPPAEPVDPELAALRVFHAEIRGHYDAGGHITRAEIREALDKVG